MPETLSSLPPPSSAAAGAVPEKQSAAPVVFELRVRNHPGAMSHITGLFSRRAFNLDAIVCVPLGDGATSRMLLLVSRTPRLDQIERQLAKLYDVLDVRLRADLTATYFTQLVPDPMPHRD